MSRILLVNYLIWQLSQYLALEPGDLILAGTSLGVARSGRYAYRSDGDTVEIDGLGSQRQQFVDAPGAR